MNVGKIVAADFPSGYLPYIGTQAGDFSLTAEETPTTNKEGRALLAPKQTPTLHRTLAPSGLFIQVDAERSLRHHFMSQEGTGWVDAAKTGVA